MCRQWWPVVQCRCVGGLSEGLASSEIVTEKRSTRARLVRDESRWQEGGRTARLMVDYFQVKRREHAPAVVCDLVEEKLKDM